ncbi:hypothetical protein ZHAS_00018990 [Anopheles sinensis]|uniref:Uncharacterized protein n=1 Tax=Anopheles sinensis TaxID=74873 RepID=A0A084WL55_ANOSI|nr:hypothetical protein ZHAS_00018990 [Anopheles sinensis]
MACREQTFAVIQCRTWMMMATMVGDDGMVANDAVALACMTVASTSCNPPCPS